MIKMTKRQSKLPRHRHRARMKSSSCLCNIEAGNTLEMPSPEPSVASRKGSSEINSDCHDQGRHSELDGCPIGCQCSSAGDNAWQRDQRCATALHLYRWQVL